MLLLKNAKIYTMDQGKEYSNGFIIIDPNPTSGKIVSVGDGDGIKELKSICVENNMKFDDCIIRDCAGQTIMPGFIDPHCHLGLWEDGQRDEDGDGNEESDPITPHMRAIDAINPFDPCFKEAVEGGITSVMTGPGSANVIGGQFAFIKTTGDCIDKMVVKAPAAMKVAFGENPKGVYGKRNTAPGTRMGTAAILREALFKTLKYKKDNEDALADPKKDAPDFDMKHEALLPVIEGNLPLKIHAHRADDMQTAIRICNEFSVKYTLDHCTEGYRIKEFLREESMKGNMIGLITGPLISERCKPELAHLSIKNPGLISDFGIVTAIMTDHPVIPLQYLPLSAAIATREGMNEQKALEAITINAAFVCDVDDRVGSLRKGKDADIVILNGHPFEFRTKVLCTIINGKIVFEAN